MSERELAACSIVSKNYLSYARVLAESFRRHHPGARLFLLLADRVDDHFSPEREPFDLVELAELGIPDLARFCFQYTVLELNTAAKPYFLRHLLRERGVSRLVYLDPDIMIYRELTGLVEQLDRWSILLTPHLTVPRDDDGQKPGERDVLNAGVYNLGFLGLRNDDTVARLLEWWSKRVYRSCMVDQPGGLFVDQRWIDLVPGLFDGVGIVRHPGYNVAYWSLAGLHIEADGDGLRVNGEPLCFFHFSGVEFDRLDRISRYQDRYVLADLPVLRPLFEDYRDRHLAAGWAEAHRWPYAFARFDNGVRIPTIVRRIYWRLGDQVSPFGNPFRTGAGSFWAWLNEPAGDTDTPITRLWHEVYRLRPDVQRAFPDPFGTHRAAVLDWTVTAGRREYEVPDELLPAQRGTPARIEAQTAAPSRRPAGDPGALGVNVAGYATSEKGVGEALRATVRALTAAGVPHRVLDFRDSGSANLDGSLADVLSAGSPHPVNIIHVNADELPRFVDETGSTFFRGRYNIGFWMWELSELAPRDRESFSYVDEVWVASSYSLEAVSRVSPVPVAKIPLALPAGGLPTRGLRRDHFGLPEAAVVFLFVFDVHSVLARKNPVGLIRAFRRAFPGEEDVRLVVKLVHGDPGVVRLLADEARDPRVIIVDRLLDRAELNSLVAVCDCYVSLHRAEGFGMTIAEAMALGKPVIATAYSGNLDFMTPENGFLVRCELRRLEEFHGPYPPGSIWAEPDLDYAAECMRRVAADPVAARRVGQRAQQDIWAYLSPDAVGARIRERLELIRTRLDAGAAGRSAPPGTGARRRAAALASGTVAGEPAATSARTIVGPAIGILKRLVRRAIRWYVTPQLADLEWRVMERIRESPVERIAKVTDRLQQTVLTARDALSELDGRLGEIESRTRRVERQLFSRPYVNPAWTGPPRPEDSGFDYGSFEERFRGPTRRIKDLLRFYVPWFEGREAIVDLGCGQGEFLELLREAGLSGVGVERDPGQAARCREKGFRVVVADACDHLASLPDESVDGVFAAQVIEHLPFDRVVAVFRQAHRKLRPRGVLVVETVNPHCLAALKLFHLDPTHVAPLYPETLVFLAESVGFRKAEVVYPPREATEGEAYYECSDYAIVADR